MSNLEIVKKLYSAFAAQDRERIQALFAPEIVWVQNEGFPGGGTHIGVQTILDEVFGAFRRDWARWKADVTRWLDAGNVIVALGEYQGIFKATGRSMHAAFAHCYWLENGRIQRFEQYTDTLKVAEAMNPGKV